MPVESDTVDVAISNCVLNLLPDKLSRFREIYRVLKPGGRLVISDLTTKESGPRNLNIVDPSSWAVCVAGRNIRGRILAPSQRGGVPRAFS